MFGKKDIKKFKSNYTNDISNEFINYNNFIKVSVEYRELSNQELLTIEKLIRERDISILNIHRQTMFEIERLLGLDVGMNMISKPKEIIPLFNRDIDKWMFNCIESFLKFTGDSDDRTINDAFFDYSRKLFDTYTIIESDKDIDMVSTYPLEYQDIFKRFLLYLLNLPNIGGYRVHIVDLIYLDEPYKNRSSKTTQYLITDKEYNAYKNNDPYAIIFINKMKEFLEAEFYAEINFDNSTNIPVSVSFNKQNNKFVCFSENRIRTVKLNV